MDFTVSANGQTSNVSTSFSVSSRGIEVLGGYSFLGGLSMRFGARRTVYSLLDTNFSSGVGLIEIVQNQGVAGVEYALGKGKDRLAGWYLRGDYAVSLLSDSNLESASNISGSLGYTW